MARHRESTSGIASRRDEAVRETRRRVIELTLMIAVGFVLISVMVRCQGV